MSHQFIDGTIFHKRTAPKEHQFKYNFCMLDFDVKEYENLNEPSLFSLDRFNLFSFYSKDHFGENKNFYRNTLELLSKFGLHKPDTLRFITLPRICGFVFNPISVVVLITKNIPTHLLAEVHNYNGGRIVYYVELEKQGNFYSGNSSKDMYVSPFFDRIGAYSFKLKYTQEEFLLQVNLFENDSKVLSSTLQGTYLPYNNQTIRQLFFKHTFLTLWVVTRTIYQSLKLKLKGLQWYNPTPIDQTRRY